MKGCSLLANCGSEPLKSLLFFGEGADSCRHPALECIYTYRLVED